MAKQHATNVVTNKSRANKFFDLFSRLPAPVQSLLADADSKGEQVDFATVKPFPELQEYHIPEKDFPYVTLEDIVENIGGPLAWDKSIAECLESLVTKAKTDQSQLEADIAEKQKRWLNREMYPPMVARSWMCEDRGSEQGQNRFLVLDFLDNQNIGDYDVSAPSWGNTCIMANGDKKPMKHTVRFAPEAAASFAHWLQDFAFELLSYAGIKDEEKRNAALWHNSHWSSVVRAMAAHSPGKKKRRIQGTPEDREKMA